MSRLTSCVSTWRDLYRVDAAELCTNFSGDPNRELWVYFVHGLLHLSGLEDLTKQGFEKMATMQEAILAVEENGSQGQEGQNKTSGECRNHPDFLRALELSISEPTVANFMSTVIIRRLGARDWHWQGCWAIGGPFWAGTQPSVGRGRRPGIDRRDSKALDLGVTFFDTATSTAAGLVNSSWSSHQRCPQPVISGQNLATLRRVHSATGQDASPEGIRSACHASLKRLARVDRSVSLE